MVKQLEGDAEERRHHSWMITNLVIVELFVELVPACRQLQSLVVIGPTYGMH
jgi:hypothetical protein